VSAFTLLDGEREIEIGDDVWLEADAVRLTPTALHEALGWEFFEIAKEGVPRYPMEALPPREGEAG